MEHDYEKVKKGEIFETFDEADQNYNYQELLEDDKTERKFALNLAWDLAIREFCVFTSC